MGDAASRSGDRPAASVSMSGPVTLNEVTRWREALLAAFSAPGPVRIDLAATGPWDLAGLQLLISALATGRRSGRVVKLAHVPRVLVAIADQASAAGRLAEAFDDVLE